MSRTTSILRACTCSTSCLVCVCTLVRGNWFLIGCTQLTETLLEDCRTSIVNLNGELIVETTGAALFTEIECGTRSGTFSRVHGHITFCGNNYTCYLKVRKSKPWNVDCSVCVRVFILLTSKFLLLSLGSSLLIVTRICIKILLFLRIQ